MKKDLLKLIKKFLEETESSRTEYSNEHDIPFTREATFAEFISWLMNE